MLLFSGKNKWNGSRIRDKNNTTLTFMTKGLRLFHKDMRVTFVVLVLTCDLPLALRVRFLR